MIESETLMLIKSALDVKQGILSANERRASRKANVAVGIAPTGKKDDYKLAVRLIGKSSNALELLEEIAPLTRGEIDVRVIERIKVESPPPIEVQPFDRVLRPGSSVAHARSTAGTLGFFARRLEDRAMGFVSCNHVIAASDSAADGDEVLSPAPSDGGLRPRDIVGFIDGRYPRLHTKPTLDCAFARLADGVHFEVASTNAILSSRLALPHECRQVEKIGRTSGRTRGVITATNLDHVDVDYSLGTVLFNGLIEIEPEGSLPFCRPGDSGALLFASDGRPVGLIMAAAFNGRVAYAHPLGSVLRSLNVELVA
jgi:hypothetical protein